MRVKQTGFSLIELMVAISILAIILTLGVPSFQQTARNNALRSTTRDLVATLNTARVQAVNLRGDTTVVPDPSGWEDGWTLTYPAGSVESNQTFVPNDNVTVVRQGDTGTLTFLARGGVAGGGASFLVCHSNIANGRRVVVSFLGKISTEVEVCV